MSRKNKHFVLDKPGIPCPRCGRPTEIRVHQQVRAKQLRQPFYYSRWFRCMAVDCATTLIMRDEFKVYPRQKQSPGQFARLDAIRDQLKPRA